MSSGEKILSTIRKDSEEAITEIQVESKEKCAKIIAKGQKKPWKSGKMRKKPRRSNL